MEPEDIPNESTASEMERLTAELIFEVLEAFFALRSAGQDFDLVTEWGAGNWGLLRLLSIEGAKTISEVAKMRSVSRQYIQKLANHLQANDLIELAVYDLDKRSKIMRITAKGNDKLHALSLQFRVIVRDLALSLHSDDLRAAVQTIAGLRRQLRML